MVAATQSAWPQRGNPRVEFGGQTIDQMISSYMEANHIPGMTLSIVQAPYIPRVVGYGLADVEKGLLASPKTLWNLGQITEAYTAVAVMQLVEAGKMNIDDPVDVHVPGLPAAWQSIKLGQLLGHISGLPDYTAQPSFDFTRDYKPDEVLALVRNIPLAFPPGESVTKCNTDFYLLGMVVEKASNMSYEAFVTRNQIERLGLRNTTFASGLSSVKHEDVKSPDYAHKGFLSEPTLIDPSEMATGYRFEDGKMIPLKPSRTGSPYGSVLASAEDVSLWDMGLAGEILVKSKANRDLIYHSIHLNDGTVVPANAGWRFPGHKGLMDIAGDVPGFSTYLSRFTAKSELVCVTLCANRGGLDLTGLARMIAGAFDAKLGPPADPKVMILMESAYPVKTTMDRLESLLQSKGITIMARVDHSAGAKKADLDLRPTETLIFGNPAVGTHLMLRNQRISLDLPLRVAVWQDVDGVVWLGYHDPSSLAERYGINDETDAVLTLKNALSAAAHHATVPY
jgi:D-alanyl-D-alanine carboxypeptidase